jgi:hypothetical protein
VDQGTLTVATTTSAPREFALAPLQAKAWLFMVVLAIALVAFVVLIPPRPDQAGPFWQVLPIAIILIAIVLPLAMLKRRCITLQDGQLVVAATFYTRKLPLAALDLDHARVADLGERTEYKPLLKTNGYALPGFAAGHFRLRNRAKAFCLLTDQERVLVLPQRDGAFLLVSPERPQVLLDALKAARG